MLIFTICRVYAEKWPLRKIFRAKQICKITKEKSQLRTWQSPVFTGSLFFCFFLGWPWSFKITNVSRHFSSKFKHGAGNRESTDLSTNRNMQKYIYYIFFYIYAKQGMVFVDSRHFTTGSWFMLMFTICRVYAVTRPLRVLFHPQQRCGITREKSKHRTWQSPVCTVCLCFFGAWPWSFNITHVSRHFSWKFKHGAGNHESTDLSTGRNMQVFIYIYIFVNAQQGMVFVGSRHFTAGLWFMPILRICHVCAVKRPLRVLFHPQQRRGFTREKSKHRTWQSPVCTVCLCFFGAWPWSFKITHVSRHLSWKFKHGAGNHESTDLSTNRNMQKKIYIFFF